MSATDYRIVDEFIQTLAGSRAVGTALEVGLIDLLADKPGSTPGDLAQGVGADEKGMEILLVILGSAGVIIEDSSGYRLSERFEKALEFRDLLEVKLQFADLCAFDLISHFPSLVRDPGRFLNETRLFKLFNYGQAREDGARNLEMTRRWVRITTTLTRYEAPVVMENHDFSSCRSILDVGGNSGEFLLRLCKQNSDLSGTVFDLPLVCEVGREHVASEPEADRIEFVGGDALSDPLPDGFDIVTFKSILHDWPDDLAGLFLSRAAASVRPGGTLLIFERGPFEKGRPVPPYSLVPFLLFSRFFRPPDLYMERLEGLGFENVTVRKIEMEMPFYLVTGTRLR